MQARVHNIIIGKGGSKSDSKYDPITQLLEIRDVNEKAKFRNKTGKYSTFK